MIVDKHEIKIFVSDVHMYGDGTLENTLHVR